MSVRYPHRSSIGGTSRGSFQACETGVFRRSRGRRVRSYLRAAMGCIHIPSEDNVLPFYQKLTIETIRQAGLVQPKEPPFSCIVAKIILIPIKRFALLDSAFVLTSAGDNWGWGCSRTDVGSEGT